MSLRHLVATASDKTNFNSLDNYIDFSRRYLEFIANSRRVQAVIVSQNAEHYRFFQYKKDGHFNITRPINSQLMLGASDFDELVTEFVELLDCASEIHRANESRRSLICNAIYTIQQSIGLTLDALPAGQSNKARKVAGDLFERLIQLLIQRLGIDCRSGTIQVPVVVDGVEEFRMSFQHDLIIKDGDAIKVIGGVKTSSKDRLDKIFVDKFFYCKLTETCIPHIAIFLNDVQRKKSSSPNRYSINPTFLPGHFKGYTIKLNPLDGVYYCDIRPNMQTDPLLRAHIRTIDHFFCSDIWQFVRQPGDPRAIVDENPNGGIDS